MDYSVTNPSLGQAGGVAALRSASRRRMGRGRGAGSGGVVGGGRAYGIVASSGSPMSSSGGVGGVPSRGGSGREFGVHGTGVLGGRGVSARTPVGRAEASGLSNGSIDHRMGGAEGGGSGLSGVGVGVDGVGVDRKLARPSSAPVHTLPSPSRPEFQRAVHTDQLHRHSRVIGEAARVARMNNLGRGKSFHGEDMKRAARRFSTGDSLEDEIGASEDGVVGVGVEKGARLPKVPPPPPPRRGSEPESGESEDGSGAGAMTSSSEGGSSSGGRRESGSDSSSAISASATASAKAMRRRRTKLRRSKSQRPSVAPGSELEKAIHAYVKPKSRKFHKPRLIKKLQLGEPEYYRRKAEKLQGKHINRYHRQYHMSYGMMLGIHVSLDLIREETSRLSLEDFSRTDQIEFPEDGDPATGKPPVEFGASFAFKDYAPRVFHKLRGIFGVKDTEYQDSLGGTYDYIEFMSNSKSGQFFFFSHDGRYMIKTQTNEESKFLRRILPHYFNFVVDNPGTFLPRFYGMHRVDMPHLKSRVHFVVMHSVFDAADLPISIKYDLKGSFVGREATEEEKARGNDKCVFKDNDLIAHGRKIRVGPERKKKFLEQLAADANWLRRMKAMDYSLLLGVASRKAIAAARRGTVIPGRRLSIFPHDDGEGVGGAASGGGRGGGSESGSGSGGEGEEGFSMHRAHRRGSEMARTLPRLDVTALPKSCAPIWGCDEDGNPIDDIYFVGIIDILQQYNLRKTAETIGRSIIHPYEGISAVPQGKYARRFLSFIDKNTE